MLLGFRRSGDEGRRVSPDVTGESGWLPAAELYGEGVFFTLDEAWLQRWESDPAVRERAGVVAERYRQRQAAAEDVDVSPRFLLCHTLAHVLIRQLDAEAGYPAASLKERIYCREGAQPMAGILIYVAVADEEGSLGGLVELARPRRFLRLLAGAFEAADWCSLDPVCAGQDGHGPDLLNRAACHACALVPETSCAYRQRPARPDLHQGRRGRDPRISGSGGRVRLMARRRFELPGIQDLSKEQEAARALPRRGRHLIVGGPGTGKSVLALNPRPAPPPGAGRLPLSGLQSPAPSRERPAFRRRPRRRDVAALVPGRVRAARETVRAAAAAEPQRIPGRGLGPHRGGHPGVAARRRGSETAVPRHRRRPGHAAGVLREPRRPRLRGLLRRGRSEPADHGAQTAAGRRSRPVWTSTRTT